MDNDFVVYTSDISCEIDLYLFFRDEWSAMQKPFVVLDLEVTDFFDRGGEIMGMHALLLTPEGGVASELNVLVKTKMPAPDWLLQELPTDSQTMAASNIDAAAAIEELVAFLGDHAVYIHHASFDQQFLERLAVEHGLTINNQVYDTLAIAEMTWPGQRCSLRGLRQHLQLEATGGSIASEDVWLTLQILLSARKIAHTYHAQRMQAATHRQPERR
jgi:DNA polymerase III alpha subunit (gram-positive type)